MVDHELRRVVVERRVRIEGDVDIPRVQRVLVEAQTDEALEVDRDRWHRELQVVAFLVTERLDAIEERAVGSERIRDLRRRRLGVPFVPDRLRKGGSAIPRRWFTERTSAGNAVLIRGYSLRRFPPTRAG